MRLTVAFILTALANTSAQAQTHPCAADAQARAVQLLRLHWNRDGSELSANPGAAGVADATTPWSLDKAAKTLKPIKALKGNGKFDVLEVNASVIKTSYRMHFIYAQFPGGCVLMGQEIIEMSDPY